MLPGLQRLSIKGRNEKVCLPCTGTIIEFRESGDPIHPTATSEFWTTEECSVCTDKFSEVLNTPFGQLMRTRWTEEYPIFVCEAGHVVHKRCMLLWDKTCPLCKRGTYDPLVYGERLHVQVATYDDSELAQALPIAQRSLKTLKDPVTKYVKHYDGDAGNEHLIRIDRGDGTNEFYKGNKGKEYHERTEYASGNIAYYTGTKDNESKVRTVDADGTVTLWTGRQGVERRYEVQMPDGTQLFFSWDERLYRKVERDGTEHFFDGDGVRTKSYSPKTQRWFNYKKYKQGDGYASRLVREVRQNGDVIYYTGPQHFERKERKLSHDGTLYTYQGPKGHERYIQREFPNGAIAYYENGRVVDFRTPDDPSQRPREPVPGYPEEDSDFYEDDD